MTKQVAEQEELTKLQKKLSEHQLKQFEEADKLKKQEEMNTPMNFGRVRMGMMTRSMRSAANMQRNISVTNTLTNSGLGAIQRGGIVGTGAPIGFANRALSSPSLSSVDLGTPSRLVSPMGSMSQLNLRTPSVQSLTSFGRLGLRTPSAQSLQSWGSDEMRQAIPLRRLPTLPNLAAGQVRYPNLAAGQVRYNVATQQVHLPPLARGIGSPPTASRFLRYVRSHFPIRYPRGQRLIQGGGGPRRSFGAFLNRHKRKFIVGGAILGAAALIGGTAAGLALKKKKSMQSNEQSQGVFNQISSGPLAVGGGGGGGGSSGRLPQRYVVGKGAAKNKKRRGSKKAKRRTGKKAGRVGKRKARRGGKKKKACSINKRGKKVCRKIKRGKGLAF